MRKEDLDARANSLAARISRRDFVKRALVGTAGVSLLGIIEDAAERAGYVDKGIDWFRKFYDNAPLHPPDRIGFLRHAGVLAGLIASGKLLVGTANAQEDLVQFGGKTYAGWEAWLMSQDLVRGPPLLEHPTTHLPSDFEHHIKQGWSGGRGAVDYDVPIGTPIVPTASVNRSRTFFESIGGYTLATIHPGFFVSSYVHLSDYTKIVSEGTPWISPSGYEYKTKDIDKLKVTAFSGNSGRGPEGRAEPPHLHFQVSRLSEGNEIESLNPFELGIDADKPIKGYADRFGKSYGGRPVYWDSTTYINAINRFGKESSLVSKRGAMLKETLDTLDKRMRESDLDEATKKELINRKNKPEELRDYLGFRVLTPKKIQDGKGIYEFKPSSLMYELMLKVYSSLSKQEFIATLPFIYPELKPIYQKEKENSGVKF